MESQIQDAVGELEKQLAAHPERRSDIAEQYIMRGELRPHPVLYLGRQADTDAGEGMNTAVPPMQSPEERLLERLLGAVAPLAMHNPIRPTVWLGKGTGTLPASFGIELRPELGFTPCGSRPLDDLLREGMPDPDSSGVIPEMREDIDAALALTPQWVKIGHPDMQGPFNIAHMLLGNEAFTAPYEEPEKFSDLMTIITDFFLTVYDRLTRWIGPERCETFPNVRQRIAECSVNMISPATYMEHVFPHDLRIAETFGGVAIHPCSGPHVFYATIRNLPNVCYQEAGFIAKTTAGAISVDDALTEIGERQMILNIGQELPEGHEEEFIRRDLDKAKKNPRLLFGYTGMHWKLRDEHAMREMHLRLDDYWQEQVHDRS